MRSQFEGILPNKQFTTGSFGWMNQTKKDNIRTTSTVMNGLSSDNWVPSIRGFAIAVVGLACAGLTCQGDDAVGTTNGTYVLADINSLATPAARQSADRTALLALTGVTEDAASYEKELEEAQAKIDAHNQALDQLNKELNDYRTVLNAYNAKLTPHNAQVAKYNSEVAEQRAEVAQSNNLPAAKRNQATVNRLNQWKARLDKKKVELNREKSDLDAQKAALDPKTLELNDRSRTIDNEAQELNAEKAAIKAKLGEAYRQLKVCYEYSSQLEGLLRKDNVTASSDDQQMLQSAAATLERLKTASDEGSVTSAEKATLNTGGGQAPTTATPQE
jgi:predicted  nucleic acid-binding Zn-ribbon protein